MALVDWYCANCRQNVRPKERLPLAAFPFVFAATVAAIAWVAAQVGWALTDPIILIGLAFVGIMTFGNWVRVPRRACPMCGSGSLSQTTQGAVTIPPTRLDQPATDALD